MKYHTGRAPTPSVKAEMNTGARDTGVLDVPPQFTVDGETSVRDWPLVTRDDVERLFAEKGDALQNVA